jgi:RNase P protein component
MLPRSTDIVIIAKKGIPEVSCQMIRKDLRRFLKPDPSWEPGTASGEPKEC